MTEPLARRIFHPHDDVSDPRSPMPRREWLVTNGLGGYASGTVAGVVTRRYHGLLVASLPAPLGRVVMLNHLLERVRLPSRGVLWLGDEDEVAGPNAADRTEHLVEFRLELGLPVWQYQLDGVTVEKRLLMPYGHNTVHVTYRMLEGDEPLRLSLRPSLQFRSYDAPVNESLASSYVVTARGNLYEIAGSAALPPLRLALHADRGALTLDEKGVSAVPYQMEKNRGYPAVGALWSPGYFRADLQPDGAVTLIASTAEWDAIQALTPEDAARSETERRRRLLGIAGPNGKEPFGAELVLAADQFIVTPAGRAEESARARAAGGDVRTVIAGYHWFTDWGRDTMHPPHVRALRARRPHSEHVPGRSARRLVSHRRRDALVLSCDRPVRARHGRHRHAAPVAADDGRHRLQSPPRDAVRHRGRSRRRPVASGGRGLSAHLDGRESR
jgi:predicted glycogen debranching enzyme